MASAMLVLVPCKAEVLLASNIAGFSSFADILQVSQSCEMIDVTLFALSGAVNCKIQNRSVRLERRTCLDNDVHGMNDPRKPAQNGQKDVDENICKKELLSTL